MSKTTFKSDQFQHDPNEIYKAAPVENWYAGAEQMAEDGKEDTAHVAIELGSMLESVQHINSHLDDVEFTVITLTGKNRVTGESEKFSLAVPAVTEAQG